MGELITTETESRKGSGRRATTTPNTTVTTTDEPGSEQVDTKTTEPTHTVTTTQNPGKVETKIESKEPEKISTEHRPTITTTRTGTALDTIRIIGPTRQETGTNDDVGLEITMTLKVRDLS